jgi:hypothetical protein
VGGETNVFGGSCLGAEGSFCYAPIGLNNSVSSCQMLCSLCISCAGEGRTCWSFVFTYCLLCAESNCVRISARRGLATGKNSKCYKQNLSQPIPVAVRLLGLWVWIPPGVQMCVFVSVVCCEVEVLAKSRCLAQRSFTDCVCVCVSLSWYGSTITFYTYSE